MTRSQRGMTLVELVITIVIIGIAAAALFSAMASITGRSADPMLRQQSLYIAESYLEAITALPYNQLNSAAQHPAPPQDVNGNPIGKLASYSVEVVVENTASLNEVKATRIDVSVRDPAGQILTLTGYRTDY
ncbi:prepilin-type N-terminal cleavage/methylation domain-containing protein [Pseudomonas sp.]|uniref:prepilin-type N-terminal cleavage/methylation domain-containing protein n=1 Tax=Pseudomonas sp. TaxID=306 RepID=UPI003D112A5B